MVYGQQDSRRAPTCAAFPKLSSQLPFLAALCDIAACFIRSRVMNLEAHVQTAAMSELGCSLSQEGSHLALSRCITPQFGPRVPGCAPVRCPRYSQSGKQGRFTWVCVLTLACMYAHFHTFYKQTEKQNIDRVAHILYAAGWKLPEFTLICARIEPTHEC